ncbi:MAG: PhoH family protein [Deltaproteobacteria bacterium]|nr:PhoH family protein [Deltaproteobacteria bacterium]
MAEIFVLDTNVLLHDPKAFLEFGENEVVIPLAVIEEIDNQKKRQDEVGRNARFISRELDGLRCLGQLSKGVPLPEGGMLRIELNHQECLEFPKGFDPQKYDNRILALAHNLANGNNRVVLVSKDLNLRIKADVMGISAEDYVTDKVNYDDLYTGYREIYLSSEELDRFYENEGLPWKQSPMLNPHEFCILRSPDNESQSALCRFIEGWVKPIRYGEIVSWGIRARNKEQRFAFDLLLDDTVQVVTLVGSAGTGKTLLALAAGLDKVIQQKAYRRFLVMRPIIPMGDDLGYLPGTKDEKLRPWMQPIFDNLEYLFQDCRDSYHLLNEFMEQGLLEMETLTYIRGRSIPNQFILCDEAQNLTPNMVKTLITRVGEGTKIIFTGDPEQIDHPYLDACSNGLTYLVEKFRGEKIAGHVSLIKGERSKVAEIGARLL